MARRQMGRERQGHTLQASALVNEAYLRLIDVRQVRWQNRAHFFARVRSPDASHPGGLRPVAPLPEARRRRPKVSLDEALLVGNERGKDLVALDDALQTLAAFDPRKSQVVELRYFGGLSVEEAAEALHVSPDTVMRDWKLAKVWLLRELGRSATA